MSYLEDFQEILDRGSLSRFIPLWEEYCLSDKVEGEEIKIILEMVKGSDLSHPFGQIAATVLPLWEQIPQGETRDAVFKLILDLQTTNSTELADLSIHYLEQRYGETKQFKQKLRIVGLRSRHSFQGCISNFELLNHMEQGAFVFHTGGWGVGEVMEISLLREHVVLEFEGIGALKDLTFENAFKSLVPLPKEHFLARRFGDPDRLETEGKKNPLALVHLLLKDLGPKTAQMIKEELFELVIPEADWAKWWQTARGKLKKDTLVKAPKNSREPFVLRQQELSHEEQFKEALRDVKVPTQTIPVIYHYLRDFPAILKIEEIRSMVKEQLSALTIEAPSSPEETGQSLQAIFLLQDAFPQEYADREKSIIVSVNEVERVLEQISIVALKKRFLVRIRDQREDWSNLFLHLLFIIDQNTLRDYLLKELLKDPVSEEVTKAKLHELLDKVTLFPEAFSWYFFKVCAHSDLPWAAPDDLRLFLEATMVLIHYIEFDEQHRDLVKKLVSFLTANRYQIVRTLIEGASVPYLEELLLLASKCHSFSQHDKKILQSLAQVVQPSLKVSRDEPEEEEEIIWTTQEGFQKVQERIQHLGSVEMIDNAHEIEAARALGDLRENAEYKFALERRARLQSELKRLSDQIKLARVITKRDIQEGEVSVGSIVSLLDQKGNKVTYTLLGPWDADTDKHILSFQSKFAQQMLGIKEGEEFDFQGDHYTIEKIESFL